MSDSVIKHAYLENEDSDIILAFAADICDSVEKTAVATEAHAKNSWFYSVPVRRLCKATSDIAIGANIVPGNGGNCIAQTIEELMANASNLAEPMSGDAFDDASSLDDGIYPIQEEDLQVIKSDMVECDDGNTVEEKLTELNADFNDVSVKVPKVILDEKKVFVKGTNITIPNLSSYDYALINIALDSASQTVLIKNTDTYLLVRGADNQGTSIRINIVQGAINGDVITFNTVAYIVQGASAVDITTGSSFYIDRVIGFKK